MNIVEGHPLPVPVTQQLAQESNEIAAPVRSTQMYPDQTESYYDQIREYANQKAAELGREVVMVVDVSSPKIQGGIYQNWILIASNKETTGIKAKDSKEEALRAAETWAKNRAYEVIRF